MQLVRIGNVEFPCQDRAANGLRAFIVAEREAYESLRHDAEKQIAERHESHESDVKAYEALLTEAQARIEKSEKAAVGYWKQYCAAQNAAHDLGMQLAESKRLCEDIYEEVDELEDQLAAEKAKARWPIPVICVTIIAGLAWLLK